nr:adenylate/guanylate cyclase domain-containing protein [Ruegeria lacuscaerulensis]
MPFIRAASKAEKDLEIAHGESERLLHNILPVTVADRLKAGEDQIADEHPRVAVMFVDIVGFTEMSRDQPPARIVEFLNKFFVAIDDLIEQHDAEKIKTIGDAIMITVGAPIPHPTPEDGAMELARDILAAAKHFERPDTGSPLVVRIGLHSGPAVAGVIGKAKFAYDIWGETVNIAARMESSGIPGTAQVSEVFASRLTKTIKFEERRSITVASSSICACIYRLE